ncbi:MAG: hypothetical protein ABEK01_00895 [Candidatus Nanohaloarchaea archaeon]
MTMLGLGTAWFIRGFLAAVFFVLGGLMWRKSSEIKITRMTSLFFVAWGMFFTALNVVFGLQTYGVLPGKYLPVGLALAHLFAFVSVGYLWRSITVLFYAKYEDYWKYIAGWGAVVLLLSIGVVTGTVPVMPFRMGIMAGFWLPGLALGVIGYRSASEVSGAEKYKLYLMTTGALWGMLVSSTTNNLRIGPMNGMWANLPWMALFVAAIWWDQVKEIAW